MPGKDLDFDELDKAVNSLMGGVKTKPDDDIQKTLTINSTLGADEKPTYDKLEQAAKKIGNETLEGPQIQKTEVNITLAPGEDPAYDKLERVASRIGSETLDSPEVIATPPAKPSSRNTPSPRRGGRFMDVVHPSSDMKTSSTTTKPVDTPTSTPVTPPAVEATPAVPNPEPIAVPAPSVTTEKSADGEQVQVLEIKADEQPLVSPFLPDTKVDKRPLGGTPDSSANDTPALNAFQTTPLPDNLRPTDQFERSRDAQITSSAADEVPAELHSELLAIETNSASENTAPVADEATPTPPAAEGPASIAQQYKESENTGDQTNGGIYDVKDYHTPLAHPAKKPSGWLWVVLTILLIIICGGAAAAAYLLLA
jgi:hypothetical protein